MGRNWNKRKYSIEEVNIERWCVETSNAEYYVGEEIKCDKNKGI